MFDIVTDYTDNITNKALQFSYNVWNFISLIITFHKKHFLYYVNDLDDVFGKWVHYNSDEETPVSSIKEE